MGVLPEALRPKPGHLSHSHQRVYEDYARFPGQNRSSQISNAVSVGPSASSGNGGLSRQFASASASDPMSTSIYSFGLVNTGLGTVPPALEIGSNEIESVGVQTRTSASSPHIAISDGSQSLENDAIASFSPALTPDLQVMEPSSSVKAFMGLYENASNNAHVDAHLVILAAIRDVSKLVVKELTSWEYNVHMAKLLDAGETRLQQHLLFHLSKHWLSMILNSRQDLDPQSRYNRKVLRLSPPPPSPGFQEQVSLLFADWYNICETSNRFFLRIMELSVSNCVSSEEMKPQSHQGQQISFLAIEVYSKRCWRKREHPLIPGKDLCSLDPVFDGANFQVHFLYKGALRVLLVLVLLHDFPEFFCDYHFSFCDVIPP
ncbi:hypothetical protein ACS0TY_001776 [Phlomoides rotata]